MSKLFIVAKREYLKVVKKWTFWISTLLFPVFILIIAVVSGISSMQAEQVAGQIREKETKVLIFDEAGLLNTSLANPRYVFLSSADDGKNQILDGSADAFIYYPKDVLEDKIVEVYVKDQGLFANGRYDEEASAIIKNSILAKLPEADLQIFSTNFTAQTRAFKDGQEVQTGFQGFILPGVALILYIILTSFATSYLLMSVSEEKENRVIEIVLSTIKSRDLVWGKILGQVCVVITQVLILTFLSAAILLVLNKGIGAQIDLSSLDITLGQILLTLFYVLMSFFIIACIMVGVGAAMPNYKEAQSFSGIFIMLSIFPVYFITAILADPNSTLATVLSYIPITSGLVLLFRNALGALSPLEVVLSSATLVLYALFFLWLAFKLFEFGAFEYGRKISFREFAKSLRGD